MVITLTINFAQLTTRRFDLQRHYSPECEVTHQSLTKGAVKRDPMYIISSSYESCKLRILFAVSNNFARGCFFVDM